MSWPKSRVGDITLLVTKGTTPTKDQGFAESGVNFIKAEALNGDSALDSQGIFHIAEDVHQKLKRSILQEDDVLLTIAGAQIGKCGIVRSSHLPANTNQAVGIMRIDRSKADPRYIYYWFKQKRTFAFVQGLNAQAAQPNINLLMLKDIEIPLPSGTEQRSIASILSVYDDLIENNRRRIRLVEQAARLLYKEWFVHLRFPGHEHVKIKDGVPGEWGKKKLKEIAPLNYGKGLNKENRIPGAYPVYGSSGIVGTHEKPLVQGPGIIIGRKGNVGSVYWSEEDFYPIDTVYFIGREKSSLYLYYSLLQTSFINTDVAVPGLNRDLAHSRELLIAEGKLKSLFEETVIPIHKQIHGLKKYNETLARARDLLLTRLMNGEVAV
jgi:type I restriction enzyme S subunit